MKIITYAKSREELDKISKEKIEEVIVSSKEFSRFSTTSFEELEMILHNSSRYKIDLVFEWDALYTELKFDKVCEIFKKLPVHEIKKIRVQDPGVLNYVLENYPWTYYHYGLEQSFV